MKKARLGKSKFGEKPGCRGQICGLTYSFQALCHLGQVELPSPARPCRDRLPPRTRHTWVSRINKCTPCSSILLVEPSVYIIGEKPPEAKSGYSFIYPRYQVYQVV